MARRAGSWPWLLAGACAFLLLFAWQRGRSRFLLIEAQRPEAHRLAEEAGVDVADVLAVRDKIGPEAGAEAWRDAVRAFAARELTFVGFERRRFELLRERFAQRR